MKIRALLLFVIGISVLDAQEPLNIKFDHFCLYHGETWPSELYRFESVPAIEEIKDELLKNNKLEQNFEFISSNVPSIAVAAQAGTYYILYSRRFFKSHPDPALQMAMIAHALGHVVNGHTFEESTEIPLSNGRLECHLPTAEEEMAADEWAGYALCRVGVSANLVETVPGQLALYSYQANGSGSDQDRIADLMRGFARAETGLKVAAHASFYEEKLDEVLKNFPKFPFPVPEYSAKAEIKDYFKLCVTLSDVNDKLIRALNGAGYKEKIAYKYVPGGFAIMTGMEQFNKDGSCKKQNRWTSKINRCEGYSPICYLNSIITTEPAYFRVFVFVVTHKPLTATEPPPSKDIGEKWLSQGTNALPPQIGRWEYKNANVTALIYEFKVRESDRKKVVSTPSELLGTEHLEQSQLLYYLKQ